MMVASGWEFAADLSDLKTVGVVDLPAMAYTFAALNNVVDRTIGNDSNGFAWESGGMSQVYAPWSQLRDDLQNLLGQTSQNIQAAAAAIVQIVDAYASTDAAAADSLNAAWDSGQLPLVEGEHAAPGTPPEVVLKP